MAVFKIIPEPYDSSDVVYNELSYISNKSKSIHLSGYNVLIGPVESMTNQFQYYKTYFGKTSGKQIEHFILSFDSLRWEDKITVNDIDVCMTYICMELFTNHQLIYSVHNNKKCLHVHIILNTISMADGNHFRLNQTNFYSFMNTIADCLSMRHIALASYTYYNEAGTLCRGNNLTSFLYLDKSATYNM